MGDKQITATLPIYVIIISIYIHTKAGIYKIT